MCSPLTLAFYALVYNSAAAVSLVEICLTHSEAIADAAVFADLTVFYLSQGVGSAIGGGIWSNLVPGKMREYIADPAIAAKAYSNPISLISKYAPGTAVRDGMARAQGETQRVLSITGTCLAAIGLLAALTIQWVKLSDEQSLAEVEEAEVGKLKKVSPREADREEAKLRAEAEK